MRLLPWNPIMPKWEYVHIKMSKNVVYNWSQVTTKIHILISLIFAGRGCLLITLRISHRYHALTDCHFIVTTIQYAHRPENGAELEYNIILWCYWNDTFTDLVNLNWLLLILRSLCCWYFLILLLTLKELTEILEKSNDPDELKYYWSQWYDHAGRPTRANFDKYIELKKEAAVLNSNMLFDHSYCFS